MPDGGNSMADIYCDFLNLLTSGDPEKLDRFSLRRNKKAAGRRIYSLREKLGLSVPEFAAIIGLDDPDDVEDLELGNFDGTPMNKLREIYDIFREKKIIPSNAAVCETPSSSEIGLTP